eukprot:TRINITY_DN14743_c0_g1_i1.p1 TRINITY_DN14743_c0_g1~~TRINITY_DN14743_c0_g1_i1.p1  ORF type:complete len:483 (-),score=69.16 TRINITY_DN14743_c0_g1_i1:22-1470(-)
MVSSGYLIETAVFETICTLGLIISIVRFNQVHSVRRETSSRPTNALSTSIPRNKAQHPGSVPLIDGHNIGAAPDITTSGNYKNNNPEPNSMIWKTQKKLAVCSMVSCSFAMLLCVDLRQAFGLYPFELIVFLILSLGVPLALGSLLWVHYLNELVARYKSCTTLAMKQPIITTKEETLELSHTFMMKGDDFNVRASDLIMGRNDMPNLFTDIKRDSVIWDNIIKSKSRYETRWLVPGIMILYTLVTMATFVLMTSTNSTVFGAILLIVIAVVCLGIAFDCYGLYVILWKEYERTRHALLDRVMNNTNSLSPTSTGFVHLSERNREREKQYQKLVFKCVRSCIFSLISAGFAIFGAGIAFDCYGLYVILWKEYERTRHALLDRVMNNTNSLSPTSTGFVHLSERNREREKQYQKLVFKCVRSCIFSLISAGFAIFGAVRLIRGQDQLRVAIRVDPEIYSLNLPYLTGAIFFTILTTRALSISK